MKRIIFLTAAVLLALSAGSLQAGTLNWGVSISSFHVAGGSANGNPMMEQLKYQMAVDSKVGLKNRYTNVFISNAYHQDTYFSFDTYNNETIYEEGSSNITVSVDADMGDNGNLTVETYGSVW